ncbi:MAG: radical SAM protein [Desulfobacula sp.]|nr:radical SAM protein [Desulfobacula sp.]
MKEKKDIKFLLINPTSPLWRIKSNQAPKNSSVFRFSMLPSLYVAAATPDYIQTQIIDEDIEPIDFNTDADLIGITFMTYNAPRAYEIADKFRANGKTVIFGGYHPTFMQKEAIQHADAICVGEAENNMPIIIEDYISGNLKPFYSSELADLSKLPIPNRKLLKKGSYITVNTMQATRGCYNLCEFCSVAAFNRFKLRTRPVANVVEELKGLGKYIIFMDDNISLDKEYAKELFTAIVPLKKTWFSQCSISIADDDDLLDLAVKSGCRGLFLGFESLSEKSLDGWKKHCNRRKNYKEIVNKLHSKGIAIFAAFVFGSDSDDSDVFKNTLDFLLETNVETLQSTRLTPFPGTSLFEKMDKQGRIFDKDWSHYDFFHVVYEPMLMNAETLHKGTAWLQKQFYSYKNIVRRIAQSSRYLSPGIVMRGVVPLNFGYRTKLSAYGAFKLGKSFQPGLM